MNDHPSTEPGGRQRRWLQLLCAGLGLYLAVVGVLMFWWGHEPALLDVATDASVDASTATRGEVTTSALIQVVQTLLDKRGGYLSNDILPPGLWLDNMPAWEYGVLTQVRDLTRALRNDFSRSQTQSTEDPDLVIADPQFHIDHRSWILPAAEGEYRAGIKALKRYRARLTNAADGDAQFYARADNLRSWLAIVEKRLGSLSQRLSASVGQVRINTDLGGERAASQSTRRPLEMMIRTPWLEIDDVFYEARGSTWALIHFLHAMEKDFAGVLNDKNAQVSLKQIIRELEATQTAVWSPVVLNGSGFGLLANHSLVMGSYISRANAAVIDLRSLLAEG